MHRAALSAWRSMGRTAAGQISTDVTDAMHVNFRDRFQHNPLVPRKS